MSWLTLQRLLFDFVAATKENSVLRGNFCRTNFSVLNALGQFVSLALNSGLHKLPIRFSIDIYLL